MATASAIISLSTPVCTGENRLIVSDIAGTTRDAVDTEVKYQGREYILIDTAGLRRKNKVKEDLEHYMIIRTVGVKESTPRTRSSNRYIVLSSFSMASHLLTAIITAFPLFTQDTLKIKSGRPLVLGELRFGLLSGRERTRKDDTGENHLFGGWLCIRTVPDKCINSLSFTKITKVGGFTDACVI